MKSCLARRVPTIFTVVRLKRATETHEKPRLKTKNQLSYHAGMDTGGYHQMKVNKPKKKAGRSYNNVIVSVYVMVTVYACIHDGHLFK